MKILALFAVPLFATAAALSAPPSVRMHTLRAPGDTAITLRATWAPPCDGRGCATSYVVRWRATNPVLQYDRTVSAATDTVTFRLPVTPDSTRATVTVFSVRRGVTSTDSAVTARWYKRDEGPPPAPSSVALDTAST